MAGHGTSLILPFEVMKDFGNVSFNADFGCIWHHAADHEWFGGVVLGREVTRGVELAAELHGEAEGRFNQIELMANVGARIDLSKQCTLLVSVGRELHNTHEARTTLIAYFGLQTRL